MKKHTIILTIYTNKKVYKKIKLMAEVANLIHNGDEVDLEFDGENIRCRVLSRRVNISDNIISLEIGARLVYNIPIKKGEKHG